MHTKNIKAADLLAKAFRLPPGCPLIEKAMDNVEKRDREIKILEKEETHATCSMSQMRTPE